MCWLNHNSYLWAFNGYVLAVLTFNTFMLFLGARAYARIERSKNAPFYIKLKNWAINCVFLSLLLSIPWLVAIPKWIVKSDEGQFVLSLIFTLLNGTVGIFIFIHRVLLNHRIMEASTRFLQRRFSRQTTLGSSSNTRCVHYPNIYYFSRIVPR